MDVALTPELEATVWYDRAREAHGSPNTVLARTLRPLEERDVVEHAVEKEQQKTNTKPGANGAVSSVLDIFREAREAIPKEEYEKLPADGLDQIDHYVYGTPKR